MEVGDKIPGIVQTEIWALRALRKILLLLFKKKEKAEFGTTIRTLMICFIWWK